MADPSRLDDVSLPPRSAWDRGGFLVLLAFFLPFRLRSASLAETLWVDEVYSLLLSHKPLGEMVDLTSFDDHPPLFYLLLHFWLRIGEHFPAVPALLWARGLSVLGWTALVAVAWFGGRRLLGRAGGALFAWSLAASAQVSFAAHDLRNYMLAMAALLACVILLLLADRRHSEGTLDARAAWRIWTAYAICASAALWLHLLSSFVVFLLGVIWLVLLAARRALRSSFAIGGLIAQSTAALSFVPWLFRLSDQFEKHADNVPYWMTPATFGNWISVFLYWYPFGRHGSNQWLLLFPVVLAASCLALAPILLAVVVRAMRRRNDPHRAIAIVAVTALLVPYLFTSTLWLLRVHGIAMIFDGARYPVLAVPSWVLGICACAVYTVRHLRMHDGWAWAFLFPWFVCCLIGGNISRAAEHRQRMAWQVPEDARLLDATQPIYVAPGSMAPYLRDLIPGQRLVPIESMESRPDDIMEVRVLVLPAWSNIQQTGHVLLRQMIERRLLSDDVQSILLPAGDRRGIININVLSGNLRIPDLRSMSRGRVLRHDPELERAVSAALPEFQRITDGYQNMEISDELDPFRWTRKHQIALRFDRPLQKGSYMLGMKVFRLPYPSEETDMTFSFEGEEEDYTYRAGTGTFIMEIPISLSREYRAPILLVRHPVWRVNESIPGSTDPRRLGFLFHHAWLEVQSTDVGAGH